MVAVSSIGHKRSAIVFDDLHFERRPYDERRAMGWLDAEDRPPSSFKSVEQGAATSVWAVTAPELEGRGGRYLEDCNEGLPATPGDRISGWAPHARDPEAAQRLWEVSERLLDQA